MQVVQGVHARGEITVAERLHRRLLDWSGKVYVFCDAERRRWPHEPGKLCVGGYRVLIISWWWHHFVIRIVCKHRISDFRSDLVWTLMLQVRGFRGRAMTICWMCESGLHPRSKQQCWALSPELCDFPRLHKLPHFYAPWCLIGSLLLATFSYWGFKPGGFSFWTSFSRV